MKTAPSPAMDDDPLAALTPDELAECARLLALSIAHHRAKFGVVPIKTTQTEAGRDGESSSLAGPARDTLAEAIAVLEAPALAPVAARPAPGPAAAAPPRRNEPEPTPPSAEAKAPALTGEEKRRQLRISVTTAIRIADPEGEREAKATLRNISWGGAAVCCDDMPGEIGERVCLLLPAGRKEPIRIVATILRELEAEGERQYGLRFESLDPEDENRLLEVLRLLMEVSDDDGRRSEARLVQRLEVEYGDSGELRATLEDISAGGLSLTVPDPVEPGQSLLVSLTSLDTPFGLNLRGKVMHQQSIGNARFPMYQVGLKFEHSNPQVRARLAAMIKELGTLTAKDASGTSVNEILEAAPYASDESPADESADSAR